MTFFPNEIHIRDGQRGQYSKFYSIDKHSSSEKYTFFLFLLFSHLVWNSDPVRLYHNKRIPPGILAGIQKTSTNVFFWRLFHRGFFTLTEKPAKNRVLWSFIRHFIGLGTSACFIMRIRVSVASSMSIWGFCKCSMWSRWGFSWKFSINNDILFPRIKSPASTCSLYSTQFGKSTMEKVTSSDYFLKAREKIKTFFLSPFVGELWRSFVFVSYHICPTATVYMHMCRYIYIIEFNQNTRKKNETKTNRYRYYAKQHHFYDSKQHIKYQIYMFRFWTSFIVCVCEVGFAEIIKTTEAHMTYGIGFGSASIASVFVDGFALV